MNAPRIISLIPSATETLCALGAADALVGISHECDYPESITHRPVLTRSRVDATGTSRAIDQEVRAALQEALSVYSVDQKLLASLAPDVIVTQDLCEICAVSLDDVRAAVSRMAHRDAISIISLRPTRFNDMFTDIEKVAAAIGRHAEGKALCVALRARVDDIARRAGQSATRPRIVSLEWVDPLMLGGMWMPELIELAGGTAVGVHAGAPTRTITSAELAALSPQVIVVKPCGFTLSRSLRERHIIEQSVRALFGRDTRIHVTDGNAFFNRPGPRLVESLEIMAACAHPELFADFRQKHSAVIEEIEPHH